MVGGHRTKRTSPQRVRKRGRLIEPFYAPYAQYDPDLTSDQNALVPILQTAIVRSYDDAIQRKYPDGIPLGGPSKENLRIDTDTLGPQPGFTIKWLGPSPYLRGTVRYPWPLVTVTIQKIVPAPPRGKAMIQVSVDQIPSVRADVQAIRANFYETMFHNEPVYNLSLESDEANKMENYLLGFQCAAETWKGVLHERLKLCRKAA